MRHYTSIYSGVYESDTLGPHWVLSWESATIHWTKYFFFSPTWFIVCDRFSISRRLSSLKLLFHLYTQTAPPRFRCSRCLTPAGALGTCCRCWNPELSPQLSGSIIVKTLESKDLGHQCSNGVLTFYCFCVECFHMQISRFLPALSSKREKSRLHRMHDLTPTEETLLDRDLHQIWFNLPVTFQLLPLYCDTAPHNHGAQIRIGNNLNQ